MFKGNQLVVIVVVFTVDFLPHRDERMIGDCPPYEKTEPMDWDFESPRGLALRSAKVGLLA